MRCCSFFQVPRLGNVIPLLNRILWIYIYIYLFIYVHTHTYIYTHIIHHDAQVEDASKGKLTCLPQLSGSSFWAWNRSHGIGCGLHCRSHSCGYWTENWLNLKFRRYRELSMINSVVHVSFQGAIFCYLLPVIIQKSAFRRFLHIFLRWVCHVPPVP